MWSNMEGLSVGIVSIKALFKSVSEVVGEVIYLRGNVTALKQLNLKNEFCFS